MPIDISAKLVALVQEPVYPPPGSEPSAIDWMNLPTQWVASFEIEGRGHLHVPLPSLEQANNLSLNGSYRVSISEG